jgi:hypothetical protein
MPKSCEPRSAWEPRPAGQTSPWPARPSLLELLTGHADPADGTLLPVADAQWLDATWLEVLAFVGQRLAGGQSDGSRRERGCAAAQLQAGGSGWLHAYVPRAPHDDSIEAELRSRMGDAAYEQAAARGRSLTGTRAVQYGLGVAQQGPERQEKPA